MKQYKPLITADHPLRQASWIWPEGNLYLLNHYARFRHDFELGSVPAKAPLFITADQFYRLWINGVYVCRGPARGYQSHWPFDGVDVSRFLRAGHNWISAECYNPGIGTFQYIHKARAGFLCAADWDDVSIRSNERDWLYSRSPAHKSDTARLSQQMGFQEWVDASKDDRSWISSETPPQWKSVDFPLWEAHHKSAPFGQPPYESVEPRGIPMLREDIIAPAGLYCHGAGECEGACKDCDNISWHFILNEFPTVKKWDSAESVKFLRGDQYLEFEAGPPGKGRFRAVTFDLGNVTPGTLIVDVDGAAGGEIIDFHYHQCLTGGKPEFVPPGQGSLIALAGRLIPSKGKCRHEFYQIMGVRHVTVVIRDASRPLKIRISWRTALYPFEMKGEFRCSDSTLNSIHDICRWTQQICSLDAYVDTPWREQAQWWGDARVQARNTFYLDGEARLLARGIRSIAGQEAPRGLTYGHAPTCSGSCVLPDFSLTWILTIWDYYWQTGDLSLFREFHSRIKRILRYFESPEARDSDGLLIYDKRFWLFEDWAPLLKDRVPAFLNLWHLYTLEYYAKLLGAAKMESALDKLRAEIAERRALLKDKLFDPVSGLFIPGFDPDGKISGEPSVHDQVLALILNLAPEAAETMLQKRVLPYLRDERMTCAAPSSFWATYLFEFAGEAGHGSRVIDFIRKKWSPMLKTGTAWEVYGMRDNPGWSYTHAWSAHPVSHFVNIIAGLRQTAPAWARVRWAPERIPAAKDFEAAVPTPRGLLRVKAEDSVYSCEIPKGVTAELLLSGNTEEISGPAKISRRG